MFRLSRTSPLKSKTTGHIVSNMNRKDDKRERILDAGLQVMFLQGYNGTGVKDIVDAAGIPKGSFYNYFESKEDFAVQALHRVADTGRADMQARLREGGEPPLRRLVALFAEKIAVASEDDIRRGCLLGNLCQEMSAVSNPIRREVDRLMRSHIGVIQGCLEEAQQRGELCREMTASGMAEFVFDAWEGALLRAKCRQDKQPLEDFTRSLNRLLGLN